MKEKLKKLSKAFEKQAEGLDGIIDALTRTTPTPSEAWAKVYYKAPPGGWPGLEEHDGADTVTLASINEIIASEYYPLNCYKIENGVVSISLNGLNKVVPPESGGSWWEVFTIDSNKIVTASEPGTTEARLVE